MRELKDQVRLMGLQAEADRTALQIEQERITRLLASMHQPNPHSDAIALRENWNQDFVSPMLAYFDGITPLMSTSPTMWDYTLNLGFYVTEAWLDILRMYARVWFAVTPQAQGCLKGIQHYVIHTGFEYQVQPKPGIRVAKDLAEKAQRIVDDFLTHNKWFETEQDWFKRYHRDGEVFPALFPQDDGITNLRTIEPWQVRGQNTSPSNMFGVITAAGDREEITAYRVTMSGNGTDAEEIGTDRMMMFKANTDKQVKRGVSDFLATQQLFGNIRNLMENTQVGEALRQSLTWIQETNGAAVALQEIGLPSAHGAGHSLCNPIKLGPGQIPTMDQNLQMKPGPVGNTDNARIALQLAYQALACYFRVPPYMVGADNDTNFASSLTEESPMVRMAQSEQKTLKTAYSEVVMQALRIAEEQELLEEGSVEKLMLNVEATPLVVRDTFKETQRNKIISDAGLLSDKTWAVREDLDLETEQANGAKKAPISAGPGKTDSTTPNAQYQQQAPRPE